MTRERVVCTAADLLETERLRSARGRITAQWPELDVETAYAVQRALIDARVAAGERRIGLKLGLTSRVKQERMGINSPLTGELTDAHLLAADAPVPLDRLIHPRVEPELVFILGRELVGPGVTAASALAAVDHVLAGIEIIDSRFRDYDFALPDVIADNASTALIVLGPVLVSPASLDLSLEAVVLSVDGEVVATATGAAVLGHPTEALALAANELAARGQSIPAGAIILTGGLTDAVPIASGTTISAEFSSLGSIYLSGH